MAEQWAAMRYHPNAKYTVVASEGCCPRCGDRDGMTFKMSEIMERVTMPPFHPNCRCKIRLDSITEEQYLSMTNDRWKKEYDIPPSVISLSEEGYESKSLMSISGYYDKVEQSVFFSANNVHFVLDVAGLIPVIGEVADVINAIIYVKEKDYINAVLSGASAITVVGAVIGSGKLVMKAGNKISAVAYSKAKKIIWPPNDGFVGFLKRPKVTIKPGTLIDRYGKESGHFVAPKGVPFTQRSLPADRINDPYRVYEIVKPIDVRSGTARPWFGQKGGGMQYKFDESLEELLKKGIIRRVEKK